MHFVRFIRFVLVGGFATAIQYLVLILLVYLAGTDPVLASAVGFLVSAIANYIVNYHYTFGSNQRHVTALSKFTVLASVGLFLNSSLMSGLIRLGLHYLVSQVIATVVVLLWNFVGNSIWTFRNDSSHQELRSANDQGKQFELLERNKTVLLLLLLAAGVRAVVALASNNEPGDADARAIAIALWALDPSFIYSGVWLPFHFYVAGVLTCLVGDPIAAGKWISFLTGSLSVIPLYRLVRRLFDPRTAWISGAYFAFYGNHVGLSSLVMSEAPFCFFALWGMDVFFAETQSKSPRLRAFLSAGLLIAVAGGFRQEGWQLAGILSVYLLFVPTLRRYAIPFALTGISTFVMWTVGNIVAGHGLLYGLLGVASAKDHEALFTQYSTARNVIKWLWIFIQSPGILLTGLAVWGYLLTLRRRLPNQLAIVAILLLSPYVVLSVLKPQWAPQHRYSVLFGILLLPYAAAATKALLQGKFNLGAAVVAIVAFSIGTQAAAYQRHSRWSLPFHDYEMADIDTWTWLAENARRDDVILVEDREWRAPGLIAHAGLYRQQSQMIFGYEDLQSRLQEIMGDTSRSYLLVLHSPPSKWTFLQELKPELVLQNADYRILRVGPRSH